MHGAFCAKKVAPVLPKVYREVIPFNYELSGKRKSGTILVSYKEKKNRTVCRVQFQGRDDHSIQFNLSSDSQFSRKLHFPMRRKISECKCDSDYIITAVFCFFLILIHEVLGVRTSESTLVAVMGYCSEVILLIFGLCFAYCGVFHEGWPAKPDESSLKRFITGDEVEQFATELCSGKIQLIVDGCAVTLPSMELLGVVAE